MNFGGSNLNPEQMANILQALKKQKAQKAAHAEDHASGHKASQDGHDEL